MNAKLLALVLLLSGCASSGGMDDRWMGLAVQGLSSAASASALSSGGWAQFPDTYRPPVQTWGTYTPPVSPQVDDYHMRPGANFGQFSGGMRRGW